MGDDFIKFGDENIPGPGRARSDGRLLVGDREVTPATAAKFYADCTKGKWPDPQARLIEEMRIHNALHNRGQRR
jgi:hypothetical protein